MISKNRKKGITYEVSNVREGRLKGAPVTRFTVMDIIGGLNGETIIWWVSVYDRVDINNGDRIRFIDIDDVNLSYHPASKKINHFMRAVIEVVPNTEKGEGK